MRASDGSIWWQSGTRIGVEPGAIMLEVLRGHYENVRMPSLSNQGNALSCEPSAPDCGEAISVGEPMLAGQAVCNEFDSLEERWKRMRARIVLPI